MRISFKSYCGNCYKKFETPNINQYLPIDNDSYCLSCRKKIDPQNKSEWIPSLFLGDTEEVGRKSLMQLIEAWNDEMEYNRFFNYMIELPKERK